MKSTLYRAAGKLRSLIRRNEILLVPLALLIGVVVGSAVALMSFAAQLSHVVIYGIAVDVRLSAHDRVSPWALMAPCAGGLLLGVMEWFRRRWRISSAVDPVEADALRGGNMSAIAWL